MILELRYLSGRLRAMSQLVDFDALAVQETCLRVVHDPGVWVRSRPSTEADRRGFFAKGKVFRVTGDFEGAWAELLRGGWVLTDGRSLGLGVLCVPDGCKLAGGDAAAPRAGRPRDSPTGLAAKAQHPPAAISGHFFSLCSRCYGFVAGESLRCASCLEDAATGASYWPEPALVEVSAALTFPVSWAMSGDVLAELSLPRNSTAAALKRRIHAHCGVPPYAQQLLAGSRIVEDDETLAALVPLEGLQLVRLPFSADAEFELLEAVAKQDVPAVERSLRVPASPDCERPGDGFTPLHIAASRGHAGLAELLCRAGADLDRTNQNGVCPLHIASQQGFADVVQSLCKARANMEVSTRGGGATPLFVSSQRGCLAVVRVLCESRADVDAASQSAATPLYIAAHSGHLEVARRLCAAGAKLDAPKRGGATPLYIASQKGHEAVVRYLCGAGADLDRRLDEVGEGVTGPCAAMLADSTPIIVASYMGHGMVVQCLAEFEADVQAASKMGTTAKDIAELRGHKDVVQMLVPTEIYNDRAGWR